MAAALSYIFLAAYHLPVVVVSALGLLLVARLGTRLFGIVEGFLATLTLATMPQFLGTRTTT